MAKKVNIIFFSIFFCFLKTEVKSSNVDSILSRTGISIEADYIAYDAQKNIILAVGNITSVINEQVSLNCTNMQVSINERKLQAQGNITITNIVNKDIMPLQGDRLFYNIQISQGVLTRVAPKIEKIYFKGEDLKPLSSIVEDGIDKNYESDLEKSNLVLVCKKITFVFGDKMEAYQVSLWSKGIKILTIPYYTTDFEIDLPDIPIAVRKVDYDSKKGIQISSVLNYSKNKKFLGKLIIDYSRKQEETFSGEKEKNIWKTTLEQQFTLGKQKSGTISVRNLGEKLYSIRVSYNQYLNPTLHINNSIFYENELSKGYNFSLGKRFRISNFSTSYGITERKNRTKSSTVNIAWYRNHQFIEKTNLSYSTSISWNHTDNQHNSTSRTDMQLDFIRSNIYILPDLYLNLNTNLSQSLSDNVNTSSFRSNITSNYKIKKAGLISVGYSVSSSKTEYHNYQSSSLNARSLNLNISLSRGNKLSARTGITYNITGASYNPIKNKNLRWSDISSAVDVRLNKLLRTTISGNCDAYTGKFNSVNVSMFYNILGENDPRILQVFWSWRGSKKTIFYYVTFNSMI